MITIPKELFNKYTITDIEEPGTLFEIELSEMTRREGAHAFAEGYAPHIKALSLDVTATYFVANLARVISAFHYAMWHDNLQLDVKLSNLTVRIIQHPKGYVMVNFGAKALNGIPLQSGNREQQVAALQAAYYGEQVQPLLAALASATGISVGMLWGVVPTYFDYYRGLWHDEQMDDVQRMSLSADMDTLYALSGDVFGRVKNPLIVKPRYIDSPYEPGKQARLKNTCCLAYKTEGGGYCLTCPRLSDQEREEKIAAYHASRA